MIKLLKNVARIGMGTRARSLLVCTGIPVLLCVMYIFACVMLGKYGIIETNTYELTVMLESGALALAISVGGCCLWTQKRKTERRSKFFSPFFIKAFQLSAKAFLQFLYAFFARMIYFVHKKRGYINTLKI